MRSIGGAVLGLVVFTVLAGGCDLDDTRSPTSPSAPPSAPTPPPPAPQTPPKATTSGVQGVAHAGLVITAIRGRG